MPTEPGTYYLSVTSAETDTYESGYQSYTVTISYLEIDAVATLSGTKNANDWYIGTVTVTAPEGFTISQTAAGPYAASFTTTQTGDNTYYLKNSTGYITGAKTIHVPIDTDKPVIGTLTYSQNRSFSGWLLHNDKIDITVPVTSGSSASDYVSYTLTPDGGAAGAPAAVPVTDGKAVITVNKPFKGTVSIAAHNEAGNFSTAVDGVKLWLEDTAPQKSPSLTIQAKP